MWQRIGFFLTVKLKIKAKWCFKLTVDFFFLYFVSVWNLEFRVVWQLGSNSMIFSLKNTDDIFSIFSIYFIYSFCWKWKSMFLNLNILQHFFFVSKTDIKFAEFSEKNNNFEWVRMYIMRLLYYLCLGQSKRIWSEKYKNSVQRGVLIPFPFCSHKMKLNLSTSSLLNANRQF